MNIWFAHCIDAANSGDNECTPYLYFSEYFKSIGTCRPLDIPRLTPEITEEFRKEDIAIIGGGGILGACDVWDTHINTLIHAVGTAIVWGAGYGYNVREYVQTRPELESCKLVGLRDYSLGSYVPCVTCMHPALDGSVQLKRKYGYVLHHYYEYRKQAGIDYILNSEPLSQVIKFIQESEVVISNSYHGCYLATLAGKPVYRMIENEADIRFAFGRYPYPAYRDMDNVKAVPHPGALKEARDITLTFFERVKQVINERG